MYNKKGIWRGFFTSGRGTPNLFAPEFPLIASQKKFEAFLGQLVKEINKTCTYGTRARSAFGFFSIFSQNSNPKNFRKKICCEVSCLEVVISLVLS